MSWEIGERVEMGSFEKMAAVEILLSFPGMQIDGLLIRSEV